MISDKDFLKAVSKFGSIRGAAKELGIPKSTAQDLYRRATSLQLRESKIKKPVKISKPKSEVKRYIVTSAQDETKVHTDFLHNLIAYANHLNADLLISGFTYNKTLFEDHSKYSASFAESVVPYLTNDRYEIGPHISFCGEMNILPTAVSPLSGLETYTREKWGIFPHAKVQLKSIPTLKSSLTKMIMTTGAVTRPNYVQKKEGIKAAFHHVYGAVIIELCPDGAFFCRHILGDKDDGSFYDLTNFVQNEEVKPDHKVLAVTWGDIHIEKSDVKPLDGSFGEGGLLDELKPSFQFIHDLIDFRARNHHNIGDPHFRFKQHFWGEESIEEDLKNASNFLEVIEREGCKTVVVESNHDLALMKWLKTGDYRYDPINARLFLESQLEVYRAIAEGRDKEFSVLEFNIRRFNALTKTVFLKEDQSYVIAGIECGMHGHLGANGGKASSKAFSRMGPKANIGHTHSAEIFDGIYTAGVTGSLDMGYNKGLSSWSHSHIVTYQNGKRAIVTMNRGRFHA
jgi:hypothetical protein